MKEKSNINNNNISPSPRGIKGEALPNHNHYNPALKPVAHTLRYSMTKAEACIWKYALRAGLMKGYTFNRQRPVLNYVADFMCKKLNLIIEVDGITHTHIDIIKKDIIRQNKLEEAGFTVIRFKDDEVLNQIQVVRKVILETIEKLEEVLPLNPPQSGGHKLHE